MLFYRQKARKHPWFALAMGLALELFVSASWAALPSTYRVQVLAQNFPPFVLIPEGKSFARDDEIKGTCADIVREMFKRAGIGYQLSVRNPFSHIYHLAKATPNTALFPFAISPVRKPSFKWVGPIAHSRLVLIAKGRKTFKLDRMEDLVMYNVGVYKDSYEADFLTDKGIPFISSDGDEHIIKKLVNGRIDLWVMSDPGYRELAHQEGVDDLRVVKVLQEDKKEYLALNINTPDEVVRRLQAALDEMRKDGALSKISGPINP